MTNSTSDAQRSSKRYWQLLFPVPAQRGHVTVVDLIVVHPLPVTQ
jgi:hypothetical protein